MRTLPLIAWLGLSACSANDDVPAPAIGAVQPDRAAPGVSVTVSGSSLCQEPRTDGSDGDPLACDHVGTVLFDTAPGVATSYTDTAVIVEVPSLPPGPVDLSISVAGRSSNHLSFTVD
ncbi:MAG TPA: IPT/TIG domain-containing protein [Kofleriaceae bacterium]|jgi:hypothetical protein|nr:IPT/TIG domain-containing protein [Kofleriaceae bacterium]